MVTIGEYILARRVEKGWTRIDLSKKSKLSKMELWRIETNRRKNVNLKIISKIAKALDFSIVNLLVETGLVGNITEAEKKLLADDVFLKIFVELSKRKDLKIEEKKNLADILLRVINSYSVEPKSS
jgi:transcriptional regulator with XRE-family HTH domain